MPGIVSPDWLSVGMPPSLLPASRPWPIQSAQGQAHRRPGSLPVVDAAMRVAGGEPGARLIAADVGGTYARLGLVGVDADGGIRVLFLRRYPCASFSGLAAILLRFREECDAGQA